MLSRHAHPQNVTRIKTTRSLSLVIMLASSTTPDHQARPELNLRERLKLDWRSQVIQSVVDMGRDGVVLGPFSGVPGGLRFGLDKFD